MGARVAKGAGEMGGWDVQSNLIFHLVHMTPGLQEGLGVKWSWVIINPAQDNKKLQEPADVEIWMLR